MPAFVYLIEEIPHEGEKSGPWTKIGYTKNPPEWRLKSNMAYGNSRCVRVAEAFEFSTIAEALVAERKAHEAFDKFMLQKEWFNISWKEVSLWMQSQGAKPRKRM